MRLPQNLCLMCHNMIIVKLNHFIYKWPSYWSFRYPAYVPDCLHENRSHVGWGFFLSISFPISTLVHYNDVIMSTMWSQITTLTIVYSIFCSGAGERNHQSSTSLAFVRGNSPVTGVFPTHRASNAENVSIWWRHHALQRFLPHLIWFVIYRFHPILIVCFASH